VIEVALHTDRLVLEPLRADHVSAVLAYYVRNRAHLEPWEPKRDESFYTLSGQEAQVARSITEAQQDFGATFVAFERGSAEITAIVSLSNIRRRVIQAATIGYSVDANRQGRGYATEAAGAVVRYAFDVLNLHRLETSYHPANERSGRVLRKLGFVVEGYARDHLLINGAWQDSILVSLTNPSWRGQTCTH
jgi:ribosomal-protein-alanine N-acetyltransferase